MTVWRTLALWAAFIGVHLVVGLLALYGTGLPLGDVTLVYRYWVEYAFSTGIWVGIDTVWVYPVLALVPMVVADLFGPDLYASTWLSLVMVADAAAFAVVIGSGRDPRRRLIGWWWLAFLLLLGPIAVGRIDSFTVPVALIGMVLLVSRPRTAAILLTLAAWVKVWPAALVVAAIVAIRQRRGAILVAAVATSGVIVIVVAVLGGGLNLMSFVTQQTGRGLQVEAPISTFWMWDAWLGNSAVSYDTAILTYQVHGPGAEIAAAVMTPLLAVVTAALLVVGFRLTRRGIPAHQMLPPLVLAITSALIVFNKVGSPQFATWLAVPIVFGLVSAAEGTSPVSFRRPALLVLLIAALTQTLYPYLYGEVIGLNPTMLLVLTARNILYGVVLAWALAALLRLHQRGTEAYEPEAVLALSTPSGTR